MIIIKVFAIFFIGVGLASIWGDVSKRIKCKESTTGKVVDIVEKVKEKQGETKVFLYPIFEYTVDGNTYTEQFKVGSGRKNFKYSIGDELKIHYMSNEPQKYYVKGNWDATTFGVLSIAVGILLFFKIL